MFDIISFIREKIFRQPKLKPLAGEELSEKQTTKMGYFLLVCMFFAIISSAQWTIDIIQNIPTKPTYISNCVFTVLSTLDPKWREEEGNTLYNDSYYSDNYYATYYSYDACLLTSENPRFDFTSEYNALKDAFTTVTKAQEQVSKLQGEISALNNSQNKIQQDYNTSLLEKTAQTKGIYDTNNIQQNIKADKAQETKLNTQITEAQTLISSTIYQNQDKIKALKTKVLQAETDYYHAMLLYKLIVAVLSFIFSLSVFFILYKLYIRAKLKNSPHTIIFSFATFAYGLIVLEISGLFIWDILPHKLLQLVLDFISAFAPLVFIVQFLWPLFIVAIFGFFVYRIQKRLYSPENILRRFISDKKCPNCGNSVDFTKPFCPLCAHEIQIHCPHCKSLTVKGMPHCSSCGGKL